MKRLSVWMSLFFLASCKFISDWSASADPSAPAQTGGVGSADQSLPVVGGTDPIDIVVTVLTLMGLPAAGRLLVLAKPLLSPLLRLLWPKKADTPPVTPAPPTAS